MAETRILFATDVHGSEICFMKLLTGCSVYKANIAILAGDITGKMIIPIIEQIDGTFKATFMGSDIKVNSKAEQQDLEKRIRNSGFYPYYTTEKELEELNNNKEKLHELFDLLAVETVKRWMSIAEERLKGTGAKLFIMPGNDDSFKIDTVLNSYCSEHVFNPDCKILDLDENHEMLSCGYSNISPWKAPRDICEEDLAKKIEGLVSQLKDPKNSILNIHCPPYDSGLDVAPLLDEKLKPIVKPGVGVVTGPVGSKAVRSAIEKHQPLLGLHGHIHESRGFAKIGRTLCLNPGSEYAEGILRAAVINLDKDRVKGYMFISG
jgi:Icc-related predicted phosphoesterase